MSTNILCRRNALFFSITSTIRSSVAKSQLLNNNETNVVWRVLHLLFIRVGYCNGIGKRMYCVLIYSAPSVIKMGMSQLAHDMIAVKDRLTTVSPELLRGVSKVEE